MRGGGLPPGYSWEPRARRWRGPKGRWVSEAEVRRVRSRAAAPVTGPPVDDRPWGARRLPDLRAVPRSPGEPAPEPSAPSLPLVHSVLSSQALLHLEPNTHLSLKEVQGARAVGGWRRLFLKFREEASERWRVVQLVFLFEHRGRRLRWSDPLSRRALSVRTTDADSWGWARYIIHRVITSAAFRRIAAYLLERAFAVVGSRAARVATAGGAVYAARALLLDGGSGNSTLHQ